MGQAWTDRKNVQDKHFSKFEGFWKDLRTCQKFKFKLCKKYVYGRLENEREKKTEGGGGGSTKRETNATKKTQ